MLADTIGGHLAAPLRLRPTGPHDDALTNALVASTLPPALGVGPLLELQVTAQRAGYAATFPGAEELVVLVGDEPVGRLWVARERGALRLVDLVVLPAHRGRGLGGALVRALQSCAAEEGVAVRLRVAADAEPAARLYARAGFLPDPGEPDDSLRRALVWKTGPGES